MCLYGGKAKIAKKNIICWKYGSYDSREKTFSPRDRNGFKYRIGCIEISEIEAIPHKYYAAINANRIEKALHSYKSSRFIPRGYVKAKCIIPKGATYYEGLHNSDRKYPGYASNCLMVQKVSKVKKTCLHV